jgi:subtilisin
LIGNFDHSERSLREQVTKPKNFKPMATTKKYLVTHSETNTNVSPVGQILGLQSDNIKHGVNLMATEAIPSTSDVLEFPNVGVTAVNLSPEQVKRLRDNKGIMAVEEDMPMHIMEIPVEAADEVAARPADAYQRGYQEAMRQFMETYAHPQPYQQATVNPYQQIHGNTLGASWSSLQDWLVFEPAFPFPFPLPFQPTPWNISMVKAPAAWARGITGNGIRLAIIDTGISSHTDLLPIAGGASFVPGVVSFNDDHSHGTHCAGIAAARNNFTGVVGVAPGASLFAVKVLSSTGNGMTSWIIAGMEWAASQGMHVVSMSLGGSNGPSIAYANAVKRLQDRGTVVVVASGNGFNSTFPWVTAPANSIIAGVPNASPIAVGSIDMNRIIASSSSRGGQVPLWNQVGVVAPGVSINSTIPGNAYGLKSGTSMATPHVAGAAALLKQRFPGISAASVKMRLMNTATDLGPAGNDIAYGRGLINCDLATQ